MSDPTTPTGKRPEYVTCVLKTPGKAFCGRDVQYEFAFQSPEHARLNVEQGGWLVTCPECGAALADAAEAAGAEPDIRNELHAAAMNVQCPDTPAGYGIGESHHSYREGHRDARHAIAEMMLSHPALARSRPAAPGEAERVRLAINLADEYEVYDRLAASTEDIDLTELQAREGYVTAAVAAYRKALASLLPAADAGEP